MLTIPARIVAVAIVSLLGSAANAAGVQRCIGDSGEPVFSDSCDNRPARARRVPADKHPTPTTNADCARTPRQLEALVQSALHSRSGIRLSGLVLWRGTSVRAARGDVRRLSALAKAGWKDVLLRSASADGNAWESLAGAESSSSISDNYDLVVTSVDEVRGDMRSQERWFGVAKDHGCYWMTLRDHDARGAHIASVALELNPASSDSGLRDPP